VSARCDRRLATQDNYAPVVESYCWLDCAEKGATVMLNSNQVDLIPEVMRAIALEYDWPDVFAKQKTIIPLLQADSYCGFYSTKAGL
jgi:hypothetical protein